MRKQELHPRTAIVNNTQKNKSKKARHDALLWLAASFPAAFDNSLRIRPLKTGIMEDILLQADNAAKAGFSKSKLREAVVLFTRRLDYLACLKLREMRIDLQGNEVGEVTEEEAAHAAAKIKKRVEKSARNARKILTEKSINQSSSFSQHSTSTHSKTSSHLPTLVTEDYLPKYPPRSAAYATAGVLTQPTRASTVVVKHKSTRQYDPNTVARLKERLGLSKSLEEKKEIVD